MSPISTIPTTSPGRNKLHIKNTRSYTSRLLSAYLLSAYLLSAYLLSAYLLSAYLLSTYLLPTFYIPYLPSTYFSTYFLHTLPRILPSFSLSPSPSSSLLLPLTFISLPLLLLPFLLSLSSPPFSFSLSSPPSFSLLLPFFSLFSLTPTKKPYFAWGAGRRSQSRLYIYMCTSRMKPITMTPYLIWPKIKNRKILCHSMFTHLAASEFHLYFFGIFRKKSKNHYLWL